MGIKGKNHFAYQVCEASLLQDLLLGNGLLEAGCPGISSDINSMDTAGSKSRQDQERTRLGSIVKARRASVPTAK